MSSDEAALKHLSSASKPGVTHTILHYIYFPMKGAAVSAAAELRSLGFSTEERLGADGSNWLVLARHEVVPSEHAMAATRRMMENLGGGRGEYDGWEAEVR